MKYKYQQTIHVLLGGIRSLRKNLQENLAAAQSSLRDYVLNKDFPLEDRFEVWAEFCDKTHHSCVIHASDVELIGEMVEDCEPIDYDRGVVYTWDHFYDALEEDGDRREKYAVTMEEVQELLIETNFGSFTNDW